MRTDQRLTEAFAQARVEYFDDSSRYVFISDCHRGNGSLSDEFTRNQNSYLHALTYYFRRGFTYIEVGDGDELWEHPEFQHIKEAHHDVFEAIKRYFDAGRFILIWGNHNNYLSMPSYVEKYFHTYYHDHTGTTTDFLRGVEPCEAVVLKHRQTGQEIFTVHGHQGDFANDQAWMLTMISVKYFWRRLHALGFTNPASPTKNAFKRHKIERNYTKWIARHRRALICGHTHRFKYPKADQLPYFNTGSCVYPTAMTALEIADGLIQLVRWRVIANAEGVLEVVRDVVRGPDPIGTFDIR